MAQRAEPLVRKTVTILFCDVTGFTSLGERVDPETMRRVMLRYFDEMRTVLERHGGTVEKFIGDAVMAIFGVPQVHEDDALRAVRAADEMRRALNRLNDELQERFGVRLEERIGLNTGQVIVGDPSAQQTIATGDAVNVAARLQQAAQPGEILLGHETYRLVADRVRAGPLETFSAKGKSEPVGSWRLDEVRAGTERVFRRLGSPLVGRTAERSLLHDLYQRALAEEACQLVTVLGPPGIGKTRLTQEVTARLFGATVAQGRCLPYGDGITFSPLADIVRTLAGITVDDSLERARRRISRLVAREPDGELVCERVAGAIGLGGEARADEAFWALRRLFEAVARERPLALVFEDIHWAEATLLDFIEYLVGWSRGAPTLVLCLARPELLESRSTWPGTRIVLDRLANDEVSRLVGNVLGSAGLDAALQRRIEAAADGNPLFVEELVYMLLDEGALVRSDDGWTLTDPSAEIAMPPTISALLAARLDLLQPEERTVLQCASVVGREFWWSSVVELAPAELRESVGTHLHALVRKRLIFPAERSTFSSEDSFRFGHILVRDAAYHALPKARRAELHVWFADWVERRTGERPAEWDEVAGYHLERAVRARTELGPTNEETETLAARAGTLLLSAGRRALARDDLSGAKHLLERSLVLLPDGTERAAAQLELAAACRETGDFTGAKVALEQAEAALAPGDDGLAARCALERVGLRLDLDPVGTGEVISIVREAIDVFQRQGDDAGVAQAWTRMAQLHWIRCRCAAMEEVLERALVHAERVGEGRELSTILGGLCRAALVGPRPVPDAINRCYDIRERFSEGPALQATVETVLAVLHAMRGSFDESRRLLVHSRMIWSELGHRVNLAAVEMYAGMAELVEDEPDRAAADLRRGYTALEAMGEHAQLSTMAALLARAELLAGNADEAARLTRVSEEIAGTDDIVSQAMWRGTRARIIAAQGDESAEQLARAAVALAAETDFVELQANVMLDLADVLRAAGGAEAAAASTAEAADLYEAKGDVISAGRARAAVHARA
jgi:class 3 adenylate cyclase/tetratricopeptide (TPR) repeat protein